MAKMSFQVSVRMLLRGRADRAGVLLRQRCTSRLRRWASRLQQQPADGQDQVDQDQVFGGELVATSDLQISEDRTAETLTYFNGESGEVQPMSARGFFRHGFGLRPVPASTAAGQLTWQGRSFRRFSGLHQPFESGTMDGPVQFRDCRSIVPNMHSRSGSAASMALIDGRRPFSSEAGTDDAGKSQPEECIHVTFINRDGSEKTVEVPLGTHMLQAAHDNDIDLEGACEASLACSTCHVIFEEEEKYNTLPDPSEEENDMLDLAFGLTPTSRLGCQVVATKELDGVRVRIPAATRNFAVDGFVPKPH